MVELDVFRTIINPNCSEFEKQEIVKKLRNILNVYACRNPYIGYCQGFNFIVAEFLISGFEENQAFWLFTYVLEVLLPLDYYTSMIGIMVDQRVFLELLRIEFPEIIEKFMQFNLDCSFFTLQWFVCLFSGITNKGIFNVIWDHFLAFGALYLFKAGLVLIQITKEQWFEAKDFPELLVLIEESVKNFEDFKGFQDKLHEIYLNKNVIKEVSEELREVFQKNVKEKTKKIRGKTTGLLPSAKPLFCEEDSPLCIDILEKNRMKKRSFSFFVFRQMKKPEVFEDYFEEKQAKIQENKREKEINMNKIYEKLVIGRHHHICIGKYIKTKTNTGSIQKEIEMQEILAENPKKTEPTDHFLIQNPPKIKKMEKKGKFFAKVKEKFSRIFIILCLRPSEDHEKNYKKTISARNLPVFDFHSDRLSILSNSRKSYDEGALFSRENQKRNPSIMDVQEMGPEEYIKAIEFQMDNIENSEIPENLRGSRTLSFNSSFKNYASIKKLD